MTYAPRDDVFERVEMVLRRMLGDEWTMAAPADPTVHAYWARQLMLVVGEDETP